jgi:ATP-dependent exoDNAse (exonuclease V) alpha subunit
METVDLTHQQLHALDLLRSGENVFLSGGAGSGKSFLIRYFIREIDTAVMPILASTGAAAVLIGGRTFHSFFGLGIMEGGAHSTLERCLKDHKLLNRLKKVEGFVIDEISMISGQALLVAETLAQRARDSRLPWGGMRVIAVGDFAQLPPVAQNNQERDWCFRTPIWQKTGFRNVLLNQNKRVEDSYFLSVLADIRHGHITEQVREFLNDHLRVHDNDDPGTRLFPRKIHSEKFNRMKLDEIQEEEIEIDSIYLGAEKFIETLMKNAPVPVKLALKIGCRVMFIQNDQNKRWVNGTRGIVTEIEADKIRVRKEGGREVQVEKASFSMMDADGNILASVIQFPLVLAYATTIHKSQGTTLDDLWCDISYLWEPGHAYVALSRLRSADGLRLIGWKPQSIIVDPHVMNFYRDIEGQSS